MKFLVEQMTCQHCVKTVTQLILAEDSQAQLSIDLATKTLNVHSHLSTDQIIQILTEEDYPTQSI